MNPFRRPSSRFGREPVPETPYQRASQVWDDRLGSARQQAYNWRLIAFGAMAVLALSVADNLRLRFGTKIVPYVVEVDRLGQARSVAPAGADYRPTRGIRRGAIGARLGGLEQGLDGVECGFPFQQHMRLLAVRRGTAISGTGGRKCRSHIRGRRD